MCSGDSHPNLSVKGVLKKLGTPFVFYKDCNKEWISKEQKGTHS